MQSPISTVLIIDDNEQKRYTLCRYLKAAGFDTWETASGEEGLRLALNQPSVIALDVKLPDIPGYDVSRHLRGDPNTARIPIIQISSTFTTSTSKVRGLNSGADAYLTGPIEPEELIATVNAMLRIRRAETIATELASKWQLTFDAISDAVVLINRDGNIEQCNRAFGALLSQDCSKAIGSHLSDVFASGPLDGSMYLQMVSSRGREVTKHRVGERWYKVTSDPVFDAQGRFSGGVLTISDITDGQRAEAASRQLAAIVESSDDAIISKDLNGIITSWNRSAEKLFGYCAAEIIGLPVTTLMPPDKLHEEAEILAHIRQGIARHHFQTIRRRKDGSLLDISLSVSPILDENRKIVGASKIVRDITEQKEAERKLAAAHREALAASQAKDDFLAALSHELRTPLNPVLLLASEAAENMQLPDEIRKQFETIRTNIELEARLIDDLLDITCITHGKLVLKEEILDLHVILRDAIHTVSAEIQAKPIELIVELTATSSVIRGDAVRLQQVFWNVLKNAVKFTPERGTITVHTSNRTTGEIEVSVSDTGIGLTENELGGIFKPFTQGEHTGPEGTHQFGGLGLGLAICHRLLEMHGGSIQASSLGRNRGSTFRVTLPTVATSAPATVGGGDEHASVPKPIAPLRILLVEDHQPTSAALASLLTRRGHEVVTASSVAEATEFSAAQAFDLLISDIGLPDGNGFELIKTLRTTQQNLQGIALTGYGMEQDVEKGQSAGFAIHLTKPIRIQSLEKALQTIARALPTQKEGT